MNLHIFARRICMLASLYATLERYDEKELSGTHMRCMYSKYFLILFIFTTSKYVQIIHFPFWTKICLKKNHLTRYKYCRASTNPASKML